MSSIGIGFAIIGSLVAFSATASADVRYTGSPKFGQFIASPAPARQATSIARGATRVFDAEAQLLDPPTPAPKGGIGARGI
jgi:hypothetical protein